MLPKFCSPFAGPLHSLQLAARMVEALTVFGEEDMADGIDIGVLRQHIGRRLEARDLAAAAPLEGMAATFGRTPMRFEDGDPVPPGWHGAYLTPKTPREALAADGLPRDTGVIPPMPLPRRMYAGARVRWEGELHVGERLRAESELKDISVREGGTGALIFVVTQRRIYGEAGLAIVEETDAVFREAVAPGARSGIPKREAPPPDLPWSRLIEVDPMILFRYSALTFNPHRIHYDRPYAMEVEGYPGLVVHGPFTQQCLVDFVVDMHPGRRIRDFAMRARAPLFDTGPVRLVGRPTAEDACELWAVTPEGTVAISATATVG